MRLGMSVMPVVRAKAYGHTEYQAVEPLQRFADQLRTTQRRRKLFEVRYDWSETTARDI